jgi:hypothetical protein
MTRGKLITRNDSYLGSTVCTKNPTSNGPALQPRLLGKNPANNGRNTGTNLQYERSSQLKAN